MFSRLVNRVRDMFAPRYEIVKTPRIIGKETHGIDPSLVSVEAKKTCEALQRRGFKAYIVGGAVRDLLLGKAPKDYDISTSATPEEVRKVFIVATNVCTGEKPGPHSISEMIIDTAEKMDKLCLGDIEFIRGMVTKLGEKREAQRAESRAAAEKEEQEAGQRNSSTV